MERDISKGQNQRNDYASPPFDDPVQEDHRNRIFEHRKCERAEKYHGDQKYHADNVAVVDE
jgi:hypothetical protein